MAGESCRVVAIGATRAAASHGVNPVDASGCASLASLSHAVGTAARRRTQMHACA